mmetsp:Transcript_8272/g.22706  ORF Transcript_8272/g.22706 Transcript_8272/m.22706 type:complete len:236 (-) Transcript_8272:211-918(-)
MNCRIPTRRVCARTRPHTSTGPPEGPSGPIVPRNARAWSGGPRRGADGGVALQLTGRPCSGAALAAAALGDLPERPAAWSPTNRFGGPLRRSTCRRAHLRHNSLFVGDGCHFHTATSLWRSAAQSASAPDATDSLSLPPKVECDATDIAGLHHPRSPWPGLAHGHSQASGEGLSDHRVGTAPACCATRLRWMRRSFSNSARAPATRQVSARWLAARSCGEASVASRASTRALPGR